MSNNKLGERNVSHPSVIRWVEEQINLCQPETVFWCDGSEGEDKLMRDRIVESGAGLGIGLGEPPGSEEALHLMILRR